MTFVCLCIVSMTVNDYQQDATILVYLFIPNQLYMFRAMSLPIIRSTWLYLQLLMLSTDIAAGQYSCILLVIIYSMTSFIQRGLLGSSVWNTVDEWVHHRMWRYWIGGNKSVVIDLTSHIRVKRARACVHQLIHRIGFERTCQRWHTFLNDMSFRYFPWRFVRAYVVSKILVSTLLEKIVLKPAVT